ncbi:C40 family peptidase [Streptomyces sp. NBC_01108]|nr:C40 family peptidase [Streptomyces sp. NBC_01108]
MPAGRNPPQGPPRALPPQHCPDTRNGLSRGETGAPPLPARTLPKSSVPRSVNVRSQESGLKNGPRPTSKSPPPARRERAEALSALKPGDLIIMRTDLSHVGFYAGSGQISHAPKPGAHVRYESIARSGIGLQRAKPWARGCTGRQED